VYTEYDWTSGDILTAARLDNLEQQFEEATEETLAPAGAERDASDGPFTPDLSVGKYYAFHLDGNLTISGFDNPAATGRIDYCVIKVRGDGNARTLTVPASVKWMANAAPTPPTTSDVEDVYTFMTWDGGTRWLGMASQAHPA
jgi:hypothetical protein